MNYPETKFLGYTAVGWANQLLFQWFFFRLQGNIFKHTHYHPLNGVTKEKATTWEIIFPVVPLTGWWSDYIPAKRWIFKLG